MSQTLGQLRVKAEFNPEKKEMVDQIKNICAKIIDVSQEDLEDEELEQLKNEFIELINSDETGGSDERERLQDISIKHLDNSFEYHDNNIDDFQEGIETACMYAVKWFWTK